jgi:hypothetical protein
MLRWISGTFQAETIEVGAMIVIRRRLCILDITMRHIAIIWNDDYDL